MEIGPADRVIQSPHNPYTAALVSVSPSPDPPTGGGPQPDDPRRRDARRGPYPDRLPVPSALPAGVRPLPDRGAAAVRRRRRAVRRLLARRGRPIAAGHADGAWPCDGAGPDVARRLRRAMPAADGDRAGRAPAPTTMHDDPPMTDDAPARLARSHRRPSPTCCGDAATVVAELAALGAEGGWRPAPGEWSANECVGHLIEAERRGFAGRIRHDPRRARPSPGIPPDLEAWDPPAVAERAAATTCATAAELAAEFAALRARRRRAGPRPRSADDLRAAGIHPEVGPLRVDELLGEWVHHDRNHVRQMLAVTQARVWGQMGNARRFSLEDL